MKMQKFYLGFYRFRIPGNLLDEVDDVGRFDSLQEAEEKMNEMFKADYVFYGVILEVEIQERCYKVVQYLKYHKSDESMGDLTKKEMYREKIHYHRVERVDV